MRAGAWPRSDDKVEREGDDKEDEMPPGAAASWMPVDDNDEERTTSKPGDVIIVTSPVRSALLNLRPPTSATV